MGNVSFIPSWTGGFVEWTRVSALFMHLSGIMCVRPFFSLNSALHFCCYVGKKSCV